MLRIFSAAAIAAACLVACFVGIALAEGTSVDQAIADACANNGAFLHWLVGVLGTVVGASALANFRKMLPPGVVAIVDALALNFIKNAGRAAPAVAAMAAPALLATLVGALLLAACSSTTLQTNLAKINADLATFNANLNADVALISADGLPALCSAAKVLDAGYKDLAPLSPKLQSNAATEAAAYAVVVGVCANPPTDTAALAAGVVGVAVQVKAMQALAQPAKSS